MLVLYAMIARAPVGQLWLAGVIPGLMMATMFIVYIAVRCRLNPELGPALPAEERDVPRAEKVRLLGAGILPIAIFAAMMVPFVNGWTSLVESSAIGALAALLAAVLRGRMTWKVFETSTRQTLAISCMFMWIILAALGFGAVFDGLGAVNAISDLFTEKLGLSPWMILILMQLSFLVMGTFLDDTAMLVIVAPLYVPLVATLDLGLPRDEVLIWYGVLYTVTTQIAYMTPPFGYNSVPDARHGAARNQSARHLRLHPALRDGDGTGAGDPDAVPSDRPVAAGSGLRPLSGREWRGRPRESCPGNRERRAQSPRDARSVGGPCGQANATEGERQP